MQSLRRSLFLLILAAFAVLSRADDQGCYLTDHSQFMPTKAPLSTMPAPLTVVAFGSSITWGDGLHPEHTFRYSVADWLAKTTGHPVQLWTFAHSAAYLAAVPNQGMISPDPLNGALNGNYPSVDKQIDCAVGNQHSLGSADLVLMDGCINEVNPFAIAAPWTTRDQIETDTDKYCGEPMKTVLGKILTNFNSATVVVVGYYPIVSSKSSAFGFGGTRRLAKYAEKAAPAETKRLARPANAPHLSRAAERNSMSDNSEAFYQHSKKAITAAVDYVNSSHPGRAFYAGLPEIQVGYVQTIDPTFAYGAPNTHEWKLPVAFLWWVINPDEEFKRRNVACQADYPLGIERLVCQSNAGFHPKVIGENAYTSSIESVIPASVVAAWKAK
jgi:hypothetical protein